MTPGGATGVGAAGLCVGGGCKSGVFVSESDVAEIHAGPSTSSVDRMFNVFFFFKRKLCLWVTNSLYKSGKANIEDLHHQPVLVIANLVGSSSLRKVGGEIAQLVRAWCR